MGPIRKSGLDGHRLVPDVNHKHPPHFRNNASVLTSEVLFLMDKTFGPPSRPAFARRPRKCGKAASFKGLLSRPSIRVPTGA